MNSNAQKIEGALILADESAEWKVAGLRQVDRLALALNEYFGRTSGSSAMPVCVWWTCDQSNNGGRLPRDQRLTHLILTDHIEWFSSEMAKSDGTVLVVNTRLVVPRDGFTRILGDAHHEGEAPVLLLSGAEIVHAAGSYSSLMARMKGPEPGANSLPEKTIVRKWYYLHTRKEVRFSEKQLLRNTGKPQDGFVSRFVNRPISRYVSGWLVRLPLLPNQWTLMVTTIPMAGSILLMRGNYLGFALGAILFQLHSALDGCDGEIARAKYLESETGSKLDGFCDRFTTLLYAVSLGVGLYVQAGAGSGLRWIYPLEGIMAALLIGISETWLSRKSLDEVAADKAREDDVSPAYLKAHRSTFNPGDQLKLWMIKNSGLLFLGDGLTSFFGQATKRDVFNFGFMLLALCGRPSWILHLLAICACAIMVLGVKDLVSPGDRSQARPLE